MENDARHGAEQPEGPAGGRLDSWKEIAAYLKRDVTTVRRWEKREALPVHRHLHDRRESVYAYREEIDAWWLGRRNHTSEPLPRIGGRRWLPAVAAAAALAAAVVALAVALRRSPPAERRAVRFSIVPEQQAGDLAFSPDGRLLAFVIGTEDTGRLWIQSLDSLTARPLAGTEGAEAPFWSPDSRFIAFGASGKLKKIAASGGLVHTLCDARVVLGGSWNRNDVIVFAPTNRAPLYRVSAAGGVPTPITTLDRSQGQNTHRWPHFLPDGRHFLYLARSSRPELAGIYAGSLDSTAAIRLVGAQAKAEYAPPGYLIFVRERHLVAQRLDLATLRLDVETVPVLDDVRFSTDDGYASFSASEHGEVAYQTAAAAPHSELVWVDRSGQKLKSSTTIPDVVEPSLSADGTRVAVTKSNGASTDIWVVDRARGSSRVTSDDWADLMPIWSPDGSAIVFASNRDGPADLYRTAPGNGGHAEMVLASSVVKHPSDWSRDGRLIVYETNDPQTGWDLWVLPLGGQPKVFLKTPFAEHHGRLSPDGRWMAYVSNESGANEVYVRSFPRADDQAKMSIGGGTDPRWRRDGRELFYVAPDRKLMSVSVRAGSTFAASLPAPLFDTHMSLSAESGYDVTPDGRQFVMTVARDDTKIAPINVLLSWATALRR